MSRPDPRTCALCLARAPEKLVIQGFRGWLAGYETNDIACWEGVWNDHALALGPQRAKTVVAELAAFVRALRLSGCRAVACYPRPCRTMCRDECIALGLLAGCQCRAWGAAAAAARALAGDDGAQAVLVAGRGYASSMAEAGQQLSPMSVAALAGMVDHPASPAPH